MSGHVLCSKAANNHINRFRQRVLSWYGANRRSLPWRAPPGQISEPYHVWLSEIMLQQTVVAAVIPYFLKFVRTWPTIHDLAHAKQEDVMQAWAGLGYYARARNLHKCAQIISKELKGKFPEEQDKLKKLPGIGDYTSAAIAAIAFDKPATVVDGNVERIMARYFNVREPLPAAKKILRGHADSLSANRKDRPGDFAQALMDLGATVCIPANPRCGLCPLHKDCAGRQAGNVEVLPYRKSREPKPQKFGYIYWVYNEPGDILFERRQASGLLGGMIGLPTSAWLEKTGDPPPHPLWITPDKNHQNITIFHGFTHFDLELKGIEARLSAKTLIPANCFWVSRDKIPALGLPTVFKKFVKIAGNK